MRENLWRVFIKILYAQILCVSRFSHFLILFVHVSNFNIYMFMFFFPLNLRSDREQKSWNVWLSIFYGKLFDKLGRPSH